MDYATHMRKRHERRLEYLQMLNSISPRYEIIKKKLKKRAAELQEKEIERLWALKKLGFINNPGYVDIFDPTTAELKDAFREIDDKLRKKYSSDRAYRERLSPYLDAYECLHNNPLSHNLRDYIKDQYFFGQFKSK